MSSLYGEQKGKEMIQTVQEQFDKVIKYSQGLDHLNTTEILKQWYEAKEYFINKFNGKLIYEISEPITFHLGSAARKERFDSFVTTVATVYSNTSLSDFLILNADGFYENKTLFDVTAPDGETTIKAGTKLIKAFKYFESDSQCLAHLQTEASMILQEDKITGTLCFSVHPLDYLSSSENNYNWRSCHALDGDYRSGNLSYMCDNTTIVCYLRGDNKEKLPRFPGDVLWNSKKWRVLLTYSAEQGMMFAGRQYPFFSEGALDIIQPLLLKALRHEHSFWSAWHDDYIAQWEYKNKQDNTGTYKYLPIAERIYPISSLIKNGISGPHKQILHFNDLLSSSCYSPYYCWNKLRWHDLGEKVRITVGSAPKCVCCGEEEISFTDSMLCVNCELEFGNSDDDQIYTCDCCGQRFINDYGRYTWNDAFICSDCQENHCYICAHCGELVFKEDSKYDKSTNSYYCPNCMED